MQMIITHTVNTTVDEVIHNLTKDTSTLLTWFKNNYFKMNLDKCLLLITNHQDEVSANIEGEIIKGNASVKLLGVHIDNKLDFNDHVSKLCKKATLKLYALSRVAHYMSTDNLGLPRTHLLNRNLVIVHLFGCSIAEPLIIK